ncbi:hypothetical protein BKH41_03850 [Helicobacter sp. 12S02232-10]|uniref:BRO family protein n=1 Tax=Helicobacter sp. 12S02232-10 TaxID=1476197 RepID=UPI000BA5496A|nr:BRO family protein [Helicobacter sp. 12S02232-10]PAF49224.1 hypothetical protein BKH41_03850 [Helicobacter sp. 12S02232-10]
MNQNQSLQIFNHQDLGQIRVAGDIENPLFCLKDVCEILEIKDTKQVRDSISEEFDKGGSFYTTPFKTKGGIQTFTMVTEPELYYILVRSNKPNAKPFRRWITSEVLPSIRKNGIYATESTIDKMMNDPQFFMELMGRLKDEVARRKQAESKVLLLTHTKKTYTATEIAKELGFKSAIALNHSLQAKKIQYQINGTWVMCSDYADLGYESIKQEVLDNGKVIYTRRITQKGREFILSLFDEVSV